MKKIIIQILRDEIKIAAIENNKMVVLGVFPVNGKSQSSFKDQINCIQKELKLKSDFIVILPEPGIFPNSENWKLAKNQITSLKARAEFESQRGIFKKQGTYLLLEIGNSVNLAIIKKDKEINISEKCLDRMVADFHEAISEPHGSRYLQDFCSNLFFLKKANKSGMDIYAKIQEDATSAELFVEYGANMGALFANLDTIFEPNCIAITGTLSPSFDAWTHAMGKMRNKHRGKKPACKVASLNSKSDSVIMGAFNSDI